MMEVALFRPGDLVAFKNGDWGKIGFSLIRYSRWWRMWKMRTANRNADTCTQWAYPEELILVRAAVDLNPVKLGVGDGRKFGDGDLVVFPSQFGIKTVWSVAGWDDGTKEYLLTRRGSMDLKYECRAVEGELDWH